VLLKKIKIIKISIYKYSFFVVYAPSSLSTSFWSFCTDLSANSARASACANAILRQSKNCILKLFIDFKKKKDREKTVLIILWNRF